MEIHLDLFGCNYEEEVLLRFGEILQFGGPKGNFSVKESRDGGRGVNWDAMTDSLRSLEEGGIFGNSKKVEFSLKLFIYNYEDFKKIVQKTFPYLEKF